MARFRRLSDRPAEDLFLRSFFTPAAPTGVTATAGNAQAVLTWTAPAIVVPPLTDYIVQFSSDSGSTYTTFSDGTSTATTATVTGLTNGTPHVFRVAATNALGAGPFSTASAAVTPAAGTPPNAPTSLTATAGNAQLALTWTAPSAAGSSAITGYTVEYTPSGGSAATVNAGSTSTSYTLTGLTNGISHSVRVRAVSAAGNGAYSTAATGTPSAASLTLVRQGSYGVSGSGTSASPWRITTGAVAGDIPTWRVTGTLAVRFVFQDHRIDDEEGSVFSNVTNSFTSPIDEFIYRTSTDPTLQKNDGRSVASLGAVVVQSGRNKTVDVTLTDCFFYMRRRNQFWGPCVDGNPYVNEGFPSVQFFVP